MGLDRAPIEFWKLVFLVPPSDHVESPLVSATMLGRLLTIMSPFDDSDAVYYVTLWSERQRIPKCVRIALFELLRQMGGKNSLSLTYS